MFLACSGGHGEPTPGSSAEDAAESSLEEPTETGGPTAADGTFTTESKDGAAIKTDIDALEAPPADAPYGVESASPMESSTDAVRDAAVTDASTDDATRSSCITAGTELCEDFESGKLDPHLWKINLGGPSPSMTVDGVHTHSGRYAAHAHVMPGQQSTAQITESVTFPATNDTFYTRIWAYFSPDVMWPDNPPDYHTGFIIAGGDNDLGHVELAVGANLSPNSSAGPMYYLGYSIYRGPPYVEFGPRSSTRVTTMMWTCIELLESGQGGAMAVRRIWVDDEELPEQYDSFGTTSPNGQAPPQFNLVSIGLWEYHPTPSLSDMWIDDVRVSSQRIGCDT